LTEILVFPYQFSELLLYLLTQATRRLTYLPGGRVINAHNSAPVSVYRLTADTAGSRFILHKSLAS